MNINNKDMTLNEFLSLPRLSIDRVMIKDPEMRIDFT